MLILCHNQFGLAAMSLATRSTYLRKSMLTAPRKSSAARPQWNRVHLTRSHERTHHMDTDIASPMSSLRHWIVSNVSKGVFRWLENISKRDSALTTSEWVQFNSFWPRCCWPGTVSWAARDWQQLKHCCDASHNNGDSATESCIHMHTYQLIIIQYNTISLNICLGWLLAASPYIPIILCLTWQSYTATHHLSTYINRRNLANQVKHVLCTSSWQQSSKTAMSRSRIKSMVQLLVGITMRGYTTRQLKIALPRDL